VKIAVLGAGMYVTGRHANNPTVMAALAECSKHLSLEQITVFARSAANEKVVSELGAQLNERLGSNLRFTYESFDGKPESLRARLTANRFDAAIISLPDHLHHSFCRETLLANLPTLVVKPFTRTLAEAKDLVSLSEKTGVYGAVEFHKRWDETNLLAQHLIRTGELGRILYINVDYSQRISIPTVVFKDWVAETNIFQYLAVHYVDLIYFLTGWKPARVTAIGTTGRLHELGIRNFDSIHSTIAWHNPDMKDETFISQITVNWIDPDCTTALSDQKYKIVGTKGRLELDQKNRGVELVSGRQIKHINPYFSEFLPASDGKESFGGYGYRSIFHFLEDTLAIKSGKIRKDQLDVRRPSFKNSLVSAAVVDAVRTSLTEDSAWIAVDELP
jgi:predicted dehydrogenase